VERRFHGCESSMERKFLEHSLLRSESSTGAKVPWNESSWTFRSPGANVPWNESSTGAKVLSMVFSLPGTKVQRNEKASYLMVHDMHMRRRRPGYLQACPTGPPVDGVKSALTPALWPCNFCSDPFILLYKNMLRSHLDYCSSVWSPYKIGDNMDRFCPIR